MATWDGHLLGGLFLVPLGLWWVSLISVWYHLKSEKMPKKTRPGVRQADTIPISDTPRCSKSWIPQPFCVSIPIEPIIAKLVAGSIGVFSETFLNVHTEEPEKGLPRRVTLGAFRIFNDSGDFYEVDKFQHVTMYSGFALSGVIDLLILLILSTFLDPQAHYSSP